MERTFREALRDGKRPADKRLLHSGRTATGRGGEGVSMEESRGRKVGSMTSAQKLRAFRSMPRLCKP